MKLRAENLVKTYKKRSVVKGISVEVNQGEIVGLLGPNGAGKTTSFYMIVGLVKPNSGNIYLDDMDITNFPMYKRAQNGIGYLAQEASVFRKLSIEDNILSVLQLTTLSKEEQEAKMEVLIAEFALEHIRTNRGDLLSGGERRSLCCTGAECLLAQGNAAEFQVPQEVLADRPCRWPHKMACRSHCHDCERIAAHEPHTPLIRQRSILTSKNLSLAHSQSSCTVI